MIILEPRKAFRYEEGSKSAMTNAIIEWKKKAVINTLCEGRSPKNQFISWDSGYLSKKRCVPYRLIPQANNDAPYKPLSQLSHFSVANKGDVNINNKKRRVSCL